MPGAPPRRAAARLDTARFTGGHRKRPGQRKLLHLEASPTGITRIVQALPGITRDRVLRIAPIVGPRKAHHTGSDEAG